ASCIICRAGGAGRMAFQAVQPAGQGRHAGNTDGAGETMPSGSIVVTQGLAAVALSRQRNGKRVRWPALLVGGSVSFARKGVRVATGMNTPERAKRQWYELSSGPAPARLALSSLRRGASHRRREQDKS